MAVSYADIQAYSEAIKALSGSAGVNLKALTAEAMRAAGGDKREAARIIKAVMRGIAESYSLPASELGAEWYEYASQAAGVDVDPAIVSEVDLDGFDSRVESMLDDYVFDRDSWEVTDERLQALIRDEIHGWARNVSLENLDRDARADRRAGRGARAGFARVPVGETCAWCFMLASLGYHYRSFESAGGFDPDRFHKGCDCEVVPYAEPTSIDGYTDYDAYVDMYERARDALATGDYSADTGKRISAAKERHTKEYEAYLERRKTDPNATGKVTKPWSNYNAVLMLMREQNGLKH